jgi:hypothetical protein
MDWFENIKKKLSVAVQKTAETVHAGGDDELGREDLLRDTCDGILKLRRHGARGKDVFPPGVIVRVAARDGSLESLRRFVADSSFEEDLDAMLRNRLVEPGALPARRYVIATGSANRVVVEDDTVGVQAVFVVEGGDKDGERYVVKLSQREWRLGRGKWHQNLPDDQRVPNDIVLSDTLSWISRAAAVIERSGAFLEVVSRQQKDFLVVLKADGAKIRPHLTASGRAPMAIGDRLEFHDGGSGTLVLRLDPSPTETAAP